ncbi:MAG TPA: molecular chaperone DnaJ [bacterium]|jgi:molecular chaperone DnaJ
MAEKQDYYELLGVDRSATQKQIKDAYRRLARKLHPDVNPDSQAAEEFKKVGEAYEVLSNADKRAQYDRFGHAAFSGMGAGPGAGGFGGGGMRIDLEDLFGGGGDMGGGFGDIFEQMFGAAMGGRRGRRGPRRGADLQFVIDLTLEDAAKGISKNLRYRRHQTCNTCNGSGGSPGTQPATCNVCNGSGMVGERRGIMVFQQTCPQCGGSGQYNPVHCSTCKGSGIIDKEETLEIKIPPGVDTNSRVRYEGMGEAGPNGGPAGDLFVIARVAEHPFFKRKGDNLYCDIPVSVYEAALGEKVRVPTLNGETTLTIPSGVSSGEEITLKSKGMPHLRGWGNGDQVCRIKVVTPAGLTRKQRELFKELQELDTRDVRGHLRSGSRG